MIHSDPLRGGVSAKVRSTSRIKKCHDPYQKVGLPIFEQHNKPMVSLNLVCCCDEFEVRKTKTISTLVIRKRSKLSRTVNVHFFPMPVARFFPLLIISISFASFANVCLSLFQNHTFFSFSLTDVLAYVDFELSFNDDFLFYSSIFRQTTGNAIGGSLSAQFANLVVMYRERALHDEPFFQDVPLCRYRDNYGTLSRDDQFLTQLCEKLSSALSMKIIVEPKGNETAFPGWTLAISHDRLPTTRVKPPSLQP